MGDQIRIPRVVITIFLLFSPSFSEAMLRTADLPPLCNFVSSIYQLSVPYVAMAVFMCIYLHYRVNKQREKFKFSSILSAVDLSKHLITSWIIRKFIELVNFVTLSVFFFSFSAIEYGSTCMSGHFREMSYFLITLHAASIYKTLCLKVRQPGKVLNGLNASVRNFSRTFHWKILSKMLMVFDVSLDVQSDSKNFVSV